MCDWILKQLEAMSHFCDLPAADQWRKNYQTNEAWWGECLFVCVTVYIYVSQLHMWPSNALGGKYIQLNWGLLLTAPPFSHPPSFIEKSAGLLGHFWSLLTSSFLPSFSNLLPLIHYIPQPPTLSDISAKDVRQWFHTDQKRQCVSSITGHREQ